MLQQGFPPVIAKAYGETISVACDNARLAKQVNHWVETWIK